MSSIRKTVNKLKIPLQILWLSLIFIFISLTLYSNRQVLSDYDWNINVTFLIYSILFALLRRLWGGVHWAYLISILGKVSFSAKLFPNLKVYFIANLASYLPGSIWYIPWRVQINKKMGIALVNTSIGSVIETVMLLISGGIVSLPLLLSVALPDQIIDFWLLLGVILGGLVAIHPRSVRLAFRVVCGLLNRQLEEPEFTFSQMLVLMSIMLAMWFTAGASLFFLIKSVYQSLATATFLFVTTAFALAWVVGFLTPFAPSGLGVRDGLLTWLFSFYIPLPAATIVAVMSRLLFVLEDISWALIMFLFQDIDSKS